MTAVESQRRKQTIGWTAQAQDPRITCATCLYAAREGASCLFASIVTQPGATCRHWADKLWI